MRGIALLVFLASGVPPCASAQAIGPERPASVFPGFASLAAGLPQSSAAGRDLYVGQVMQEATRQGVPPALADAVAVVETGYNPRAVGGSGEIGLMQIMPATAAQLGFRGTIEQLFEPATNIRLAVQYLGRAWALSGGNVCRALMKYRAGWGEETMSPLSVQYCQRAHGWLATIRSPLATGPGAVLPLAPFAADPFTIATSMPARRMTASWHPPPLGYQYHRLQADRISALADRIAAHRRHF